MALLPFLPRVFDWEPSERAVLCAVLVLVGAAVGVLLTVRPPAPPPAEEDDDPFTFP